MKVKNKMFVLAIACVGLSAGTLFAAKPSLTAAMTARTIGNLYKVIRTASLKGEGDFFVYNTAQQRYTSPKAAGIELKLNTTIMGQLTKDPGQIQAIKTMYGKKLLTKKVKSKTVEYWVDMYTNYLLYFNYGGHKIYINNPWPAKNANAVYNIIQKWTK